MGTHNLKDTTIRISYWTFPEGDDFESISKFEENVNKRFNLKLSSRRTDALGAGLYELVIEVVKDISIQDLLKSYAEDGIKVMLGYTLKYLIEEIKTLFNKNRDLSPDVDRIKLKFRDCKIYIYSLYNNSIPDNYLDILDSLDKNFPKIVENLGKKVAEVHIPIFDKWDYYSLCQYRVKLEIDEVIEKFTRQDYFSIWGIRKKKKQFVYYLEKEEFIKQRFITQKEYDKLIDL